MLVQHTVQFENNELTFWLAAHGKHAETEKSFYKLTNPFYCDLVIIDLIIKTILGNPIESYLYN